MGWSTRAPVRWWSGGVALELIVRMGLLPDVTSVEQVRQMRFTRNADLVVVAQQVPTGRTSLCSDPEKVKLAADRLFRDAGVRILYHTQIVDVLRLAPARTRGSTRW